MSQDAAHFPSEIPLICGDDMTRSVLYHYIACKSPTGSQECFSLQYSDTR